MSRYFAYHAAQMDARPLKEWAMYRWHDELLSVLWLYNRTGDPPLLDFAKRLSRQGFDWKAQFADFRYTGKVSNWKDVGGKDGKIIPYSRENSSGTYVFFKEHVLENADFTPRAQNMPGTAAVVQYDLRVNPGTPVGATISNQAVVSSAGQPSLLTDSSGNPINSAPSAARRGRGSVIRTAKRQASQNIAK